MLRPVPRFSVGLTARDVLESHSRLIIIPYLSLQADVRQTGLPTFQASGAVVCCGSSVRALGFAGRSNVFLFEVSYFRRNIQYY